MKILQICFRVPFPPHDGGAIAMYNITKGLSKKGYEVFVFAVNTPKHFQEENVLQDIARMKTVFIDTSISSLKAFLNLFKAIPYNIERFISKDFEEALISILQNEKFDIIHFEGLYVAHYADAAKKYSSCPVILRTHNLEYLIWKRLAENEKNIFKKWYLKNLSKKLLSYEKECFKKFDAIAAISPEDAVQIKKLGVTSKIEVVPVGVDLSGFKPGTVEDKKPKTLFILSALEWKPNLEAVDWFLNSVWPGLSKKNPELELHIAGKKTPPRLMNMKVKNVFVHGFVPDAFEFMQKYELMLVPLLSGSGVRIKIIEGMAAGKCILTSSVGAEGIDYTNEKNILIADTPEEWINTISDYFNDLQKHKVIGMNAQKLIADNYDNDKVIEKLIEIYKSL